MDTVIPQHLPGAPVHPTPVEEGLVAGALVANPTDKALRTRDASHDGMDVDDESESSYIPPSMPPEGVPLTQSYTYLSSLPSAPGPYVLGIDEAGRGPALGPLVYAIAFCPVAYVKKSLETMGFDDSKTLSYQEREELLQKLSSDPENLGWAVRVVSPQSISQHMLSKPPTNLNQQSQAATVHLITSIISALASQNPPAVISEIYVDALGPPQKYEQYLKHLFPNVEKIDVRAKADSIFKIVGAASIAAKVTRDAWVDNWAWEEDHKPSSIAPVDSKGKVADNKSIVEGWTKEFGSGYPSDPNTRDWLANHFEPIFGFPSVARFSWAPVKTACETKGAKVLWTDEAGVAQKLLVRSFESQAGLDKGRCFIAKELSVRSVATL